MDRYKGFMMQTKLFTQQIQNNIINLLNSKQFKNADDYIDIYLSQDKMNANLWHLKSIANQGLGNLEQCMSAIQKTLKLNPKHLPALANLAKLHSNNKNIDDAFSVYKKILVLSSNDISALFHIGVLLNDRKQYKKALVYLLKANQLNCQDINIKIALGQSYLNTDDLVNALNLFNKVLLIQPNNLAALNNKGITLKRQCLWQDAINTLQLALELSPSNIEIIKNLASCLTLKGEYQASKDLYKQAVSLNPLDIDAHHWLNQILWENKDPEFLDSYKYALKKHNQSNELMLSMGHKLFLAGEYSQAKEILEQSIDLNGSHYPTLVKYGVVLRELGDLELSHSIINKASKYGGHDLLVQEELAISFLSIDKPRQALKILNKLLKAKLNNQGLFAYKSIALKLLNSAEYDYFCNYDHVLMSEISIPKGFSSLKDFNVSLVDTLRNYHHAKTNPLDQSLISGSQTSEKLFDYHVPIIQQLRTAFREQTSEFFSKLPIDNKHPILAKYTGKLIETDSWSVILHNKGFHKNHHHPAGWYSGPYYAQTPKIINNNKDKQGWLKLGQPGFKMMTQLEPDRIIEPKEGLMIRFPSYFWHGTIPFKSNEERITVTEDIKPI
jgi:tetratricopeptide (TPR) repeat protein